MLRRKRRRLKRMKGNALLPYRSQRGEKNYVPSSVQKDLKDGHVDASGDCNVTRDIELNPTCLARLPPCSSHSKGTPEPFHRRL